MIRRLVRGVRRFFRATCTGYRQGWRGYRARCARPEIPELKCRQRQRQRQRQGCGFDRAPSWIGIGDCNGCSSFPRGEIRSRCDFRWIGEPDAWGSRLCGSDDGVPVGHRRRQRTECRSALGIAPATIVVIGVESLPVQGHGVVHGDNISFRKRHRSTSTAFSAGRIRRHALHRPRAAPNKKGRNRSPGPALPMPASRIRAARAPSLRRWSNRPRCRRNRRRRSSSTCRHIRACVRWRRRPTGSRSIRRPTGRTPCSNRRR